MPNILASSATCFLLVAATVRAYTSETLPRQPQLRRPRRPVGAPLPPRRPERDARPHRPLAPPFPNGPCGGTVVTLPRRELFPGQSDGDGGLPFLKLNLGALSSLENVVLPPRDVKVWLPREYHAPAYRDQRFPILYCHDGQNAMEDASSWTGSSWRLIGALTRLSERHLLRGVPPVVVCLPCGEGDLLPGMSRRHSEYGDYTHPISQAHGEFVATKLHPYVRGRFRVADGPEHVATIGSSLGGQASLQLLLRYPETFGAAACLSPCFTAGTIAAAAASLAAGTGTLRAKTLYIDNGGDADAASVPVFDPADHFTLNEGWWNPGYWWLDTSLQPMVDAMRWTLDRGGVDYVYEKFPGGRHNERAWAQRIHRPLLALYGRPDKSTEGTKHMLRP